MNNQPIDLTPIDLTNENINETIRVSSSSKSITGTQIFKSIIPIYLIFKKGLTLFVRNF